MLVQFLKPFQKKTKQIDQSFYQANVSHRDYHLSKGTRIRYVFQVRIFPRNLHYPNNNSLTSMVLLTCLSKVGLWRPDGGTNLSTSLDCLPRWSCGAQQSQGKTGQQWLQMLQVILKANGGFNHCGLSRPFVASKKNIGILEFPIFGHLGRFNVKASGYDKLTATVLVVLV